MSAANLLCPPPWLPGFDQRHPLFAPLRTVAGDLLDCPSWPTLDDCAGLLQRRPVVSNHCGMPIQPVLQDKGYAGARGYEAEIAASGELPTRPENWHDFFNLLVWRLFPNTKALLNALHQPTLDQPGGRSPQRDALTLFDESGVVVLASPKLAECIAGFRWKELFWQHRAAHPSELQVLIFGHALFEKALQPYVGMTGHALVLPYRQGLCCAELDRCLAQALTAHSLTNPRQLQPFPLLGMPGWWPQTNDERFYDNTAYFRPGRMRLTTGAGI